jgi:hypothetical protein
MEHLAFDPIWAVVSVVTVAIGVLGGVVLVRLARHILRP